MLILDLVLEKSSLAIYIYAYIHVAISHTQYIKLALQTHLFWNAAYCFAEMSSSYMYIHMYIYTYKDMLVVLAQFLTYSL